MVEQALRRVEMPVDGRDHERRRAVGRAHLVDVRAAFDQRLHGVKRALPRREMQRGEAALLSDQLVERDGRVTP